MGKNDLKPLIKTTTLRDKEVNVKDTMKFERTTGFQPPQKPQPPEPVKEDEKTRRQKAMKTQKMSLDVMLKLDILDPFLRAAENIDHDRKISINDKIDLLISSYINSRLSTRQLEGFKAIYETYLGE